MASRQGRIHPREEWETLKDTIYQKYLGDNETLETVLAFINNQYAWGITPRQLKSKIKEWGFDIKRTRGIFYRAMLSLAQYREMQNKETAFNVPKRLASQEYQVQRIKKEVDRQRNQESLPSPEEAQRILEAEGYRCFTPHPNEGERFATSPMYAQSMTSDEDEDFMPSHPPMTAAYFHPQMSSMQASNLGDNATLALGLANLHISANIQGYSEPCFMVAGRDYWTYTAGSQPQTPKSSPGHNTSMMEHVDNRSVVNTLPHGNYDFFNPLESLCPGDGFKHRISRWAGPYYWQAFRNSAAYGCDKTKAMDLLQYTLSQDLDNPYVFPCLSWMVTVLGSNEKNDELIDFLKASCTVVDRATNCSLMRTLPFHFALAVHTRNHSEQLRYGAYFEQCHQQMRAIWGLHHPNTLVTLSFWAWHLLDIGESTTAIRLLEYAMPCLGRVMGWRDLLTIHCLAILSRGYQNKEDYTTAIQHMKHAIQQLEQLDTQRSRSELTAWRSTLNERLGFLYAKIGSFGDAEEHLKLAVGLRLTLFGLETESTWGAIVKLCDILAVSGQKEESDLLYQDFIDRNLWQQWTDHRAERGEVYEEPIPVWRSRLKFWPDGYSR